MTVFEGFGPLLETTCAASAAVIVVLAARRALRAWFGAQAAYASWLAIPVVLIAVALPARVVQVRDSVLPMPAVGTPAPVAAMDAGTADAAPLLWGIWLAGVAIFVLWNLQRQRRFVRGLGRLRDVGDDAWQAEADDGLPAVIGLRARIVLPSDFETRFSAAERALILAHERVHIARRDVPCNALFMALRAVFWFNPLFWFAAGRFRRDQELACDQAVIARHPRARRQYAEAMMKAQYPTPFAPLACQWLGHHPSRRES